MRSRDRQRAWALRVVIARSAPRLVARRLVPRMPGRATAEHTPGVAHADSHDERRGPDLLQGLGLGPTNRAQSWLAALGRRLGRSDAVLPRPGLSGHRARPPWARPVEPDRRRS